MPNFGMDLIRKVSTVGAEMEGIRFSPDGFGRAMPHAHGAMKMNVN